MSLIRQLRTHAWAAIFVATTGCGTYDLSFLDGLTGPGQDPRYRPEWVNLHGQVRDEHTGELVSQVQVRLVVPPIHVDIRVTTTPTGTYWFDFLAGNCAGLTLTFAKPGYRTAQLLDPVPCSPGTRQVNVTLLPE